MAKRTPADFRKAVKRVIPLDTPRIEEIHIGNNRKYLNVVLFQRGKPGNHGSCKVRVDFSAGEAEVYVFIEDRPYHSPQEWQVEDLEKFSTATKLAAEILEEVNGRRQV